MVNIFEVFFCLFSQSSQYLTTQQLISIMLKNSAVSQCQVTGGERTGDWLKHTHSFLCSLTTGTGKGGT